MELETKINDTVFKLVHKYLESNEHLNYPLQILNLSKNVETSKIGCLLDICIWSSQDNGTKQIIEIAEWINSIDEFKIEVALSMTNVFLLNDLNLLKQKIIGIGESFPNLGYLSNYWIPIIENQLNK